MDIRGQLYGVGSLLMWVPKVGTRLPPSHLPCPSPVSPEDCKAFSLGPFLVVVFYNHTGITGLRERTGKVRCHFCQCISCPRDSNLASVGSDRVAEAPQL